MVVPDRKLLLLYLCKAFDGHFTTNLAHKSVCLAQCHGIFGLARCYDIFYFEKEGPVCPLIELDLIELESLGYISYFDYQNQIVSFPSICDNLFMRVNEPQFTKIVRHNRQFFNQMKLVIEAIRNLGTEEDYNLLSSIAYIDQHIKEFVEEPVDSVDFTALILNEYRKCTTPEIKHLRGILESRGIIEKE